MGTVCLYRKHFHHSIPALPSFPCRPEPSIPIDCRSEGSLIEDDHEYSRTWEILGQCRVTIDMLPNVVLLEVFECYLQDHWDGYQPIYHADSEQWPTLVHVCQKWRGIIFGSPRRLNLQLHCNPQSPARELLGIWPPLPILIWYRPLWDTKLREDNIIAALEHNDRVCQITLDYEPNSRLENFVVSMQEPFPALTALYLLSERHKEAPILCDSFLGGYAPRLQYLFLTGIPFPALPKLLLSATHLVTLHLWYIPHSGYISPEAMVTALSVLTRLEKLKLSFRSPQSYPNRESGQPPPPTLSVLPSLTFFHFKGVSEYLEDLMARINAPQLDDLNIIFLHQLIFDIPQLTGFISRTLNIKTPDTAIVYFSYFAVEVEFARILDKVLKLEVSCRSSDWQLSSVAQVCSSLSPLTSSVEHLYVDDRGEDLKLFCDDEMENSQWLELLHPFASLKALYLSRGNAPRVAAALQDLVGERTTEVLPALQRVFMEELHPSGPVQESIDNFIAARQLSGHPIAVSHWEKGWVKLSAVDLFSIAYIDEVSGNDEISEHDELLERDELSTDDELPKDDELDDKLPNFDWYPLSSLYSFTFGVIDYCSTLRGAICHP